MAAVVDVQPRVRDEPPHQVPVRQRDDRVVVTGHDQRLLPQQRQERQARPAQPGGQLVEVAAVRADPVVRVHRRAHPRRVGPRGPAVQAGRDPFQVAGVQVTPRGGQPEQDARAGRHHDRAGRGAYQHETTAPRPLEGREVLGDPAAPGDAEHVHGVVAEDGEHPGDHPAQPGEAVRGSRRRRAADTGNVEPDHAKGGIKRVHERLQQLQAGPDAVDHQQRDPARLPTALGDPELLAVDAHAAHRLLARRYRPAAHRSRT